MKAVISALVLGAAVALLSTASAAHASQIGGGIQVPGEWWLGEGLKQGDYFSYRLCHVDYKECTFFEVDFWIQGDRQVGSEAKWLAQAVVYDGGRVHKGELEFGKITAEPTEGTDNLATYRVAIKSSISWLSSFATSYGGEGGKGPKEFSRPSWAKIGDIGGVQVAPQAAESVTVPAGTFDAIRVGWKTGGAHSHIWIVDGFPFPVKASTWTHVAEGQHLQEYALTLLDYRENVQEDPFAGIQDDGQVRQALGCPDVDQLQFTSLKKPTAQFNYNLEVLYKPEQPKQGCDIEWLIKFEPYDETEFLNQVQYDIMVVDDDITFPPLRSLADEDARKSLYSTSGLAERTMLAREPAGENNYLIMVYGLAPEFVVPDFTRTPTDYLLVPITVQQNDQSGITVPSVADAQINLPSWIKGSAEAWSMGITDDSTFLQSIGWLIDNGVIVIPPTEAAGDAAGSVPSWVRDATGAWSAGIIGDRVFVDGITWLIENGVIAASP